MEQAPETGTENLIDLAVSHPILAGLIAVGGLIGLKVTSDMLSGFVHGLGGVSGRKYDN